MITLQQVIQESTGAVLDDIRQMDDPVRRLPEIEQSCMQYMQVKIIRANNCKMYGEQNLYMPKHLDFSQVAAILNEILDLRTLPPGPKSNSQKRRLALFDPDGGCMLDMSGVKRMALELDNSLTDRGMNRILDRLRLIAPEHAD